MNKSKVLSSEIVYKSFFNVRNDSLEIEGKPFNYLSIETAGDAVLILPITSEGKYVLTLEYRYPVRKTLLSIPGGYIDAGEKMETAAERELLEETGYKAKSYRVLGSAYPYPGISSQKLYYVIAEDARLEHPPHHEISEQIETDEMTPSELSKKIAEGFPIDGNLCTILFFANHGNFVV